MTPKTMMRVYHGLRIVIYPILSPEQERERIRKRGE